MRYFYLLTIFIFSGVYAYPQNPGDLDLTFGNNGISAHNIGNGGSHAYSIATCPDDKIIAAGGAINGGLYGFAVAKYNVDGTLDNSFGNGGYVMTQIGSSYDVPWCVDLQSDDKIVVVGETWTGVMSYDFAVVRYNSNGTLDMTFSGDGILTLNPGSPYNQCNAVKVLPGGKILVAGNSKPGATMDFCIALLNADGTLDNTFGTNGIVFTDIGSGDDYAYGIAVQPGDNKIVVSGSSYQGSTGYFTTVRYNTDGSLDNTFNGTGIAVTGIGTGFAYSIGVRIQSDGKILVAGNVPNGTPTVSDFGIVRYLQDGTLDPSFGTGGKTITSFGSEGTPFAIALQPDDKCLVGGWVKSGTQYDFALVRYGTGGMPDNTFGNGGIVFTAVSSANDNINSIALQSDGKIVVGGGGKVTGDNDFVLARYFSGLPVGAPEPNGPTGWSLSPNPVHSFTVLNSPAEAGRIYRITILEMNGRIVYTYDLKGTRQEAGYPMLLEIPGNLYPGNYVLRIDTEKGQTALRFLKVSQ